MSVTLNNALNNQSHNTIKQATAVNSPKNNSTAFTDQYEETNHKNVDVFEIGSSHTKDAGIYSNIITSSDVADKTDIKTIGVNKIEQRSVSSSGNVYLDTVIMRAAKKAGVGVGSNGVPRINSSTQASIYNAEMSRIKGTFWCQTGGWEELPDSDQCGRTAAATMASINSGYTVTPNDTTGNAYGLTGIKVNGREIELNDNAGTYNVNAGPKAGLNKYNCGSESGVIAAINNELKNGRSVLVKTTVSGRHWVTVTGTLNGKPAESFDDFVGVDPWYNGSNPNNPLPGTGSGSTNADRAGIIQLSDVSNQNLHSDYVIITYAPGSEAAF